MKNKFEHIDFESVFKEKLNSFEYNYNSSSWKKIKKEIPNNKISVVTIATIIISTIIILGLASYFIFNKKSNNNVYSNETAIISIDDNYTNKNNIDNIDNLVIDEIETKDTNIKDNKNVYNNSNNDNVNCIDMTEVVTETVENKDKINTVIPIPKKKKICIPSAEFFVNKYSGCEDNSFLFTPSEISDTVIYMWKFGDGTFSNERQPNHKYKLSGKYSVTLSTKYYHSEKINTKISEKQISVYDLPDANFSWLNENDSKFIFSANILDYDSYLWKINNQNYYSSSLNFEFNREGIFPVMLIVTDKNNCVDSLMQNINIEFDIKIHMPNGFTPDGDEKNDYFGVITDAQNINEFLFNIYNTKGQLVFTSDNLKNKWDGTIMNSNVKAPANIYFWEYYIKTSVGVIKKQKGKVTLIRK